MTTKVEKKSRTLSEWLTAFLEADAEYYANDNAADNGGLNIDGTAGDHDPNLPTHEVYEADDWDHNVRRNAPSKPNPGGAGAAPGGLRGVRSVRGRAVPRVRM